MKPRFSILTLLAVTAYFGVAATGVVYPSSRWVDLNLFLWIVFVVWLGLEATSLPSKRGIFAIGALAGILAYVGQTAMGFEIQQPIIQFLWKVTIEFKVRNHIPLAGKGFLFTKYWCNAQLSLLTGLLGGALALWRYRVLERRSKPSEVP